MCMYCNYIDIEALDEVLITVLQSSQCLKSIEIS